jgi:DNA-binding IclR family transcriptional regulator
MWKATAPRRRPQFDRRGARPLDERRRMVSLLTSFHPAAAVRARALPLTPECVTDHPPAMNSSGRVERPRDARTRLLRYALNVMDCLLHEPRSLGISEVAARLRLPKSTTFRILHALVELEMVHKDPATRRYSLSSRVFGFVHELTIHFGPIGRFSHVLRKEAERLKASLYVSTLSGGFTYVVAASGARGDSFALGGQAPVYASSAGKVLVALRPEKEWENYAPTHAAQKLTRHTNTDGARFRLEMQEARTHGVAWNREESALNYYSVAAPIIEPGRAPRFAVAILVDKREVPLRDLRELEDAVKRIARRLGES